MIPGGWKERPEWVQPSLLRELCRLIFGLVWGPCDPGTNMWDPCSHFQIRQVCLIPDQGMRLACELNPACCISGMVCPLIFLISEKKPKKQYFMTHENDMKIKSCPYAKFYWKTFINIHILSVSRLFGQALCKPTESKIFFILSFMKIVNNGSCYFCHYLSV